MKMYRQEIDDSYQVINRRNADFRKKKRFFLMFSKFYVKRF